MSRVKSFAPRLDGVGRTGFRDRPPTALPHPGPGGTATRPVGGVGFWTGLVRVVTGFGNEEVRAVTGFGNDDVKVVTGFGNQGSRVLQGSWTDAGAGDKGSPVAVEAGGVIIAWGRSVRAADLGQPKSRDCRAGSDKRSAAIGTGSKTRNPLP